VNQSREAGMGVDVGHVTVAQVNGLAVRLSEFVKPFQDAMGFPVQERRLGAFVGGLLGGTERKEVIALAAEVQTRRRRHGKRELLVAVEALAGSDEWCFLSRGTPCRSCWALRCWRPAVAGRAVPISRAAAPHYRRPSLAQQEPKGPSSPPPRVAVPGRLGRGERDLWSRSKRRHLF